jgi:hypothetical protein
MDVNQLTWRLGALLGRKTVDEYWPKDAKKLILGKFSKRHLSLVPFILPRRRYPHTSPLSPT